MASLTGCPDVLLRSSPLLVYIHRHTHTHTHTHTAMGRGLLTLVVELVVVALSLAGGAPSPTPDLDCDAADYTVLKEGHTQFFPTMALKLESMVIGVSLVKPESGFKGLLIDVVDGDGSGTHHTAWLPGEDCVSPNGTWWRLSRGIMKTEESLEIRIDLGTCRMKCEFNITETGLMSLSVEAHGPSKWRTRYLPKECGINSVLYTDKREVSCQEPPSSILPTHTTTSPPPLLYGAQDKITIIMLSGAVVVLLGVLVLVCWKRRSVTSPNVVRFPLQPAAPSRSLESTICHGHAPDQDKEHVYYEILPDLSTRRVVVPQPAQNSEEPVYDVMLPPRSPHYENLPAVGGSAPSHGYLEPPGIRDSQLYATVL